VIKLNIVLFAIVLVCALALVTSQHEVRKLFTELTRQQETAKQIDVEWGQLQLEQSTWGTHGRVEGIARDELHMVIPRPGELRIVQP